MEHGAWSMEKMAQGARPKVEEIDYSFFRYALGAMRSAANGNR